MSCCPLACHVMEQYANNAIEADHGRLKSRLRSMRGLKITSLGAGDQCSARVRADPPRGHYDIATHIEPSCQLPAAFAELALAI